MSYNVDNVDVTKLNAWMYAKDIKRLYKLVDQGECAEGNFLEEHIDAARDAKSPNEKIHLLSFEWYGEGSGHCMDTLKKKIAPKVMGEVVAILTWEGGDSISSIRIKDGKYEEGDVEQEPIFEGKGSKGCIVLAGSDDWEGLYVDGRCVAQTHSISAWGALEAIVKSGGHVASIEHVSVDQDWLEGRGDFPVDEAEMRNNVIWSSNEKSKR